MTYNYSNLYLSIRSKTNSRVTYKLYMSISERMLLFKDLNFLEDWGSHLTFFIGVIKR